MSTRNFVVDFSRITRYSLYPTHFVIKMIFIQLILSTAFFIFLVAGDFYISYTTRDYCELFSKNDNTFQSSSFLYLLKK